MPKSKHGMWVILYAFFFLLGCTLAYFSFQQYQKTKYLLEDGIRTVGIVKRMVVTQDDDGPMYSPVFEFTDRVNQDHEFKSKVRSRPPAYTVGEKVKLVYERKNPKNVKVVSFWGLYAASVILAMVASPLLILGFSYLVYQMN